MTISTWFEGRTSTSAPIPSPGNEEGRDGRPEDRPRQKERPAREGRGEESVAREPVEENPVAGVQEQQPCREDGRPGPELQRDDAPGDDRSCVQQGQPDLCRHAAELERQRRLRAMRGAHAYSGRTEERHRRTSTARTSGRTGPCRAPDRPAARCSGPRTPRVQAQRALRQSSECQPSPRTTATSGRGGDD